MPPRAVVEDVYGHLLHAVQRGVYGTGTRLPAERVLAADLEVSRTTLRVALQRLADEGLLENSAQRGWFVPRPPVGEPPSVLQSFSEMARARGLRPTSHVLHRGVRRATFAEAERLRVAPAAELVEVRRLRGMDGTPVCVDENVLPLQLASALLEVDLEDVSLFAALEASCGVHVHRSTYSVQAVAADADVAPLLQVPEGSPVLLGEETTYTVDGTPVMVGRARYRGDAYRFQADLYRPRQPGPQDP